jgi:UDP-N-acetylmuramoylalanine--D-glutamate ligase
MMKDWKGSNVLIIGAARQGVAMARYLAQHGARVIINDQRSLEQLTVARQELEGLPIHWEVGGHPLYVLDEVTLVCVSGGVPLDIPLVSEAQKRGIPLSNDSQIFLEAVPCPVIGITGSAGKTTTTTLVGRIADAAAKRGAVFRKAWVGGNIGTPLIADVDEIDGQDLAIIELSSFQLELMTVSPHIAAVLNVTPNHLDRHKTMEAYTAAKTHILIHQREGDVCVLNRDDPGSWQLAGSVRGQLISFGLDEPETFTSGTYQRAGEIRLRKPGRDVNLMNKQSIALRGEHNLMNVLAACAIAVAAGMPLSAMQEGVEGFYGVPHRLELVRVLDGVQWYNDSIATAPERAIAAIGSFEEPLVLLAGGRDKNLPWEKFAEIVRRRVDHLILFGEASEIIARAMDSALSPENPAKPYTIHRCPNLHEAVLIAESISQPGDVVLLSPGGTSFDEFKDFEERGERFRTWVKEFPQN